MDWFKMQTIWGAALDRLSDTEAGRFIKAIYAFVRYGEEYDGSGKEELLVCQALEMLRNDIEKFAESQADADKAMKAISEKRKQAANKRWQKQKDASASSSMQNDASASDAMQNMQNAPNKNKNKIKNNKEKEEDDYSLSSEDSELLAIQKEHDEIFQAMEYAGFATDSATMDKVIDLYAIYGKEKILTAIDACVENSVKKVVYLKGVLEGMEKDAKGGDKKPETATEAKEETVRWLN